MGMRRAPKKSEMALWQGDTATATIRFLLSFLLDVAHTIPSVQYTGRRMFALSRHKVLNLLPLFPPFPSPILKLPLPIFLTTYLLSLPHTGRRVFLSADTKCSPCTQQCPSGFYATASCESGADIQCAPCSSGACPSGQYMAPNVRPRATEPASLAHRDAQQGAICRHRVGQTRTFSAHSVRVLVPQGNT